MYESHHHQQQQQNLVDLQDPTGFGSDPMLSVDDHSSISAVAGTTTSSTGNVDLVLFNDLVQMVPLVQTLMEQNANTSFTRRGSIIYTKKPSRESIYKKTAGKSARPTIKNKEDQSKNAANNQDGYAENFSSMTLLSEKDREELIALRDKVGEMQRKLSEKDELLKSAELSKSEIASLQMKLDGLKNEVGEKDSLIKSTQLQLYDAKVKLADKQAALEKIQWEAMNSNKKVEKLQGDLETVQGENSSFMLLLEGLTRNDYSIPGGDYEYDCESYPLEQEHELDYLNEIEMQKLESAREAYIAAFAAAKENPDEESMAAAATARLHLKSLIK